MPFFFLSTEINIGWVLQHQLYSSPLIMFYGAFIVNYMGKPEFKSGHHLISTKKKGHNVHMKYTLDTWYLLQQSKYHLQHHNVHTAMPNTNSVVLDCRLTSNNVRSRQVWLTFELASDLVSSVLTNNLQCPIALLVLDNSNFTQHSHYACVSTNTTQLSSY